MTEPHFIFWPLPMRDGTELWRWECWGHGYDAHKDDESPKTAYARCLRTPGRRHATREEAEASAATHATSVHPVTAAPVNNGPITIMRRKGGV